MGVVEKGTPEICIVLFVPLWQNNLVDQGRSKIQFQFLEFLVELPPGIVLDLSVILVALDHFLESLGNYLLKYFLQLGLLVFFACFWRTRILLFLNSDSGCAFSCFRFVGVEELQHLGELVDVDALQKSVIIILECLFPLLDEGLIITAKQFPWREDRQVLFELALFTAEMEFSHEAEPLFE